MITALMLGILAGLGMFTALGGFIALQEERRRRHGDEGASAIVYEFPSDGRNSAPVSKFTEGVMIWECPTCKQPASLVEDPYPWPDADSAVSTHCCRTRVAQWTRETGETYPNGKPVAYPR